MLARSAELCNAYHGGHDGNKEGDIDKFGQMLGPTVAGVLSEYTGSFRAASLLASTALLLAAVLAFGLAAKTMRPAIQSQRG